MNVKRRTQGERSAATRAALVASARRLFGEHGFSAVGTEAVVRDAGVTRGALYHQFDDKTELFAAVFEDVERETTEQIAAAVAGEQPPDALTALQVGADAWMDICSEPQARRILLIDGPAVLGWARWREIGLRYGLGLVEAFLEQAVQSGQVAAQPVSPLAHMLIGAIDEAALYLALSEDKARAREEVGVATRQIIGSLAG